MFINKIRKQGINGVLRTPRVLDTCFRSVYWNLSSLEKDILGQRTFFRADYAKEVADITKIINNANRFGNFSEFLEKNPNRAKEVMQHIYTVKQSFFDKFKESFHIQNTTPLDHTKRDTAYEEFHKSMINEISKISTLKPDFGYCNSCINCLDRKQKKRYPNLKKMTDDSWNYKNW